MKLKPYERGKGRFQLDEAVTWQAGTDKKEHVGRIVEVVKYGMYPAITQPPARYPEVTWPELQGQHYYREHESYVVEDAKGKRWWPRVGNLRRQEHAESK
jgi:hypothetical protein